MTACVQNPGSIRDLATAVASGETTASSLVERYLTRIDEVQPLAAPWREVDGDRALQVAAKRDAQAKRGEIMGPLHGVPLAHKDMYYRAGRPSACGSVIRKDFVPDHTSTALAGLDAAGALGGGAAGVEASVAPPEGLAEPPYTLVNDLLEGTPNPSPSPLTLTLTLTLTPTLIITLTLTLTTQPSP